MQHIVMRPSHGSLITFVQGRVVTTLVAPVAIELPEDEELKFEGGFRIIVGPRTHLVGALTS